MNRRSAIVIGSTGCRDLHSHCRRSPRGIATETGGLSMTADRAAAAQVMGACERRGAGASVRWQAVAGPP